MQSTALIFLSGFTILMPDNPVIIAAQLIVLIVGIVALVVWGSKPRP